MGEKAQGKAERLLKIEQLLLAHPEGLTRAEIARRLGVHRATIGRDIDQLSTSGGLPIYEDGGRLKLNRDAYLTKVRFTMHEALAIHLAARLMATRMDKWNPHAASALRKLGQSLEALAPPISRHVLAAADVMDESGTVRRDPLYLKVLEKLTRAWSEGRMVHLLHEMEDGRTFEYDFAPYFIEPYAIGRTTHVIGWRDPPKKVRTFKIERIRWVELLPNKRYTIPQSFDPRKLLRSAWGIWYTEGEPIRVRLRFSPRVARRVRETRWHASERVEEQEDGSLIWEAEIAEMQEMLPWIRGWGADVEVLEPPELRRTLEKEVRRMAEVYELAFAGKAPPWQRLWAKYDHKSGRSHPLVAHLIDVGMVAQAMWERSFTPALRARVAGWLGLEEAEAGRLLAFWIALHDLGKATPAFQAKVKPMMAQLRRYFPFDKAAVGKSPHFAHGSATYALLRGLLPAVHPDVSSAAIRNLARVLGGHHGSWPVSKAGTLASGANEPAWQEARRTIVVRLQQLFHPSRHFTLPEDVEARNAFWTFLSGYTSTADWLGSMETYFPFVDAPLDLMDYAQGASQKAIQVLEANDWTGWQPPEEAVPFTELFRVEAPRPMQEEVIRLSERLVESGRPALVILEAPTGSGKTEAALYLADRLIAERGMRGFYVAMPTMATSNQMYERVRTMLEDRYEGSQIQPLLLHSQARWTKEDRLPEVNVWGDHPAAMRWFLRRRRGLLAPFAVGTVDQALLTVLKTKHFFVRHFGLSGKVLIFDEVHAYDTYMSTLFERLLRWLRELGATVIILSATLPQATRRRLLATYAVDVDEGAAALPAPALSWVEAGHRPHTQPLPVAAEQQRDIALQIIERDELAERLEEALREGGCAAVLCNTVRQAQETYRRLHEAQIVPDEALFLFHARYPMWRRQEIEEEVLDRFGKRGERPQKAIVVATQVIEQSLDLDFDLTVSDVAPIDLLIQRVGRLHRHRRPRPAPLREPRLLLIRPREGEDGPDFGNAQYIYERDILWLSWNRLRQREHLRLPDEAAALIESVYGDEISLEDDARLLEARRQTKQKREEEMRNARQRLIPDVAKRSLLRMQNMELSDDDDPTVHQDLQAMTRLSPPSVRAVCLHRMADGSINTRADGSGSPVDLSKSPDQSGTASTYELVQTMITVPVWVVRHGMAEMEENKAPGWKRHPLLQYVYPLVFEGGRTTVGEFRLTLEDDFGLSWYKLSTT